MTETRPPRETAVAELPFVLLQPDRLSREQAVARLRTFYSEQLPGDLQPVAGALGDLAEAIELSLAFLRTRGKKIFADPIAFHAVLCAPAPANAFDHAAASSPVQPPDLGLRLNNLGRVAHDFGELQTARRVYELAIVVDRAAYGVESAEVARDSNKLGTVLHDSGELEEASSAYRLALAIDQACFGESHPAVARDLNNLAILLRDGGDLPGAYDAFGRAWSICQDQLGEQHPYTQIVQRHLQQLESEY